MARAGKVVYVDILHDLGTVKCTRNPETAEDMMSDEIDGYVDYMRQAYSHSKKPQVRRTFESMAVDEFNHFRILQQLKEHGHINPRQKHKVQAKRLSKKIKLVV